MNERTTPFWRDDRFIKIFGQVIIVSIVVIFIAILIGNFTNNFQRLGLNFSFSFLFDADRPASFRIGDSPIPYRSTDPYILAVVVGLLNSLRVTICGIILATVVGVTIGIARLSNNWLIRQLGAIYVGLLRNTPLLLQLFFWYFMVFLRLPKIENYKVFWNSIFLSNQGMYFPFPDGTFQTWLSLFCLIFSLVLAIFLGRKQKRLMGQQGEKSRIYQILSIGIAIAAILLILFGLNWQGPQYNASTQTIEGGVKISPEFATLLVGLTAYTAAFIAEVVRAGIQSVPQGQWEAGKALGLKPNLMMQLVIFPQALRVIIPPLTSEFLNLAKNSSLAIAIGYNDIYAVSQTISNQTGKAVEMLLVVMIAYLTFNLIISSIMNWFNYLTKIKER